MTILPGVGQAVKDLFSHDEAFGLPQGTVRGTVFIIFAVTLAKLAFDKTPIPPELSNTLSAIVGFYFGQKIANGHEPPKPAQ